MKRLGLFVLPFLVASCGTGGQLSMDKTKILQAAVEATQALTISDNDIANLSRSAVQKMDTENKVATAASPYVARLTKLTRNIKSENGLVLNFKVYETNEVNAFATGDGSIRVYTGLMDKMNDAELMAILGHEIGHIVNTDVKDAMKNAYISSAARTAIGAVGGTLGKLSDSQLGAIALAFTGAQYSQKQEHAADDYGFNFAIKQGFDPISMSNALKKLVQLSNGAQSSLVQKMFSSHPDSANRATRMAEKAKGYKK